MPEKQLINHELKGAEKMVEDFFKKFDSTYNPTYFANYQGINYISVQERGQDRTLKINSQELDNYLVKTFRNLGFKWGANKNLITRLKDEMNALAILEDKKEEIHIRVAGGPKGVFIDRGIKSKEIIQISPGSVPQIITKCNFKFVRPAKQRELPQPIFTDFDFNYFKSLFNFSYENDALLLLAFILKSLTPNSGPCPILILEGPQGSGKTTATTIIGKIIDPTEPSLFAPPKTEEDIKIQANSSWLLTYDNLSYLNGNLTDAFCRVSTGGGMSSRKLYTDDEEIVYSIQRPVVFNGIEELGERPDFLDRGIILHTKVISEKSRKFSDSIWDPFDRGYPSLLGGVYNLLSEVLLILPTIEASNLPRMADYAKFGIALEKALSLPEGTFMNTYNVHNSEKLNKLFDSDPMCIFIEYAIDSGCFHGDKCFIGTASELMEHIDMFCKKFGISRGSMPQNPKTLKGRMARIKPVLSAIGIEYVELPRTSNKRPFYLKWKDPKLSPAFQDNLDFFLGKNEWQKIDIL